MLRIESLTAAEALAALDDLVALLQDAVASGASLGFLDPLDDALERSYWRSVIANVERASKLLLVARAEVHKVCVLRSACGQGIDRSLMVAIEDTARTVGAPCS